MGVYDRLQRSTERLETRIHRLRAKGGSRRELKAAKLDLKAELNRIVLRDWMNKRWANHGQSSRRPTQRTAGGSR